MNPIKEANAIAKALEFSYNSSVLDNIIEKAEAQVMDVDAIPVEQIRGDLNRMGHPPKQMVALDAANRIVFFMDLDGQALFAEFGDSSEGNRVKRIGHQSAIAKEYDPIDLEPSTESGNFSENITTTHEEADAVETVGMYPGGTPGDAPEEDDRGFGPDPKPERRESFVDKSK